MKKLTVKELKEILSKYNENLNICCDFNVDIQGEVVTMCQVVKDVEIEKINDNLYILFRN